ncbi:MAG: hypothetical protein PHF00_09655, partial [Elusimicrobia bacterium]|nr:hypothetical protein [Elusimicrobiota bacterium]
MARAILPAALCAGLLCACSRPGREAEPDNDFAHAAPLRAGRAMLGTICASGDEDWYKIAVARDSGILNVHVGGIRDVDFVLSFRGRDQTELKRADETGVGGDERLLDLGVEKGEYFLVVSNKNPKADNPGQQYLLTTKLESAAGREREPNDRLAQASALELNGVTRGHYFPSVNLLSVEPDQAEEDWFKIAAPGEGVFSLSLDLGGVPNVDPVLEFYDGNGYKLKEFGAAGAGTGTSLNNLGVRPPMEYALRLRTRGRRMANAEVFYELLSELRPYDGRSELEPDDQRQDAVAFAGDSISGNVAPAGDEDWYRVDVASGARLLLRAEVSAVAGLDLVLAVRDELGAPLLTVDNAGQGAPEVLTGLGATSATYYLV